ncbi:L,D-transpeptidase family protein [Massilia suwonensis]|uniref:L,D-transpeptidase family protein n=1 Tax=Massilia suwonensis TaxID=648895 RepID=A0ABW0MU33_9BURK
MKNIAAPLLVSTMAAVLAGALPATATAGQQMPQPAPQAAPQQAAQPGVSDPAAAERAEFERLLRAQVLLDRLHFSPGEIDGAYGSNMRQALASFQKSRNLEASGKLDDATWNALNTDTTPTLTAYVLTNEDVAGPFQPIPEDMMDKAKLPKLGYASPAEGLGEKFHASPDLIVRLNPGKNLAKAGEQIVVPSVHGGPTLPAASKVVVSDSRKVLMLFDGADRLIAQYPASTGSQYDPLPIGEWKIEGVHPNPTYHYNPKLFWDAEPGDKKAKVAPGPNNPVGVVWIDLSKPHYGIHGTPVPKFIGKTESHGCIRLTNWSAAEVAAVVAAGTQVVLQE